MAARGTSSGAQSEAARDASSDPRAGGNAKKKAKYDTQGAGSRSRRTQARLEHEVKNIQRLQHNLPVATVPLQQQIRWEAKLQAAEAARLATAAQVQQESVLWKASSPPPGTMSLPSYIPPGAKFMTPCPLQNPQQEAPRHPVPKGVPMCPDLSRVASVPAAAGPPKGGPPAPVQLQPTTKGCFPSSSSSSLIVQGSFQGAMMYGSSTHIGAVKPCPVYPKASGA